jgi:rhodanese-related sulfurtransferase
MKLADDVVVYPAHGAGSLCGKGLSDANSSTIGDEKLGNYALKPMSEDEFVKVLTADQPFIPKYFGYDVSLNKQGAPDYQKSVEGVDLLEKNFKPEEGAVIVDARSEKVFKKGHYKGAINIQNGGKFETWLGSIVGPNESFYLAGESKEQLRELIAKASKIGYELLIKGAFVYDQQGVEKSEEFNRASFEANKEDYTIVDIRNTSEVKAGKFFDKAMSIPLPELRERASEIPKEKPVVIHCAGGYRSAAGSSIVEAALPGVKVLDMSEAVTELKQQ